MPTKLAESTSTNGNTQCYGAVWRGQTWLVSSAGYGIYSAIFKMYRSGSPGTMTFDLYLAGGDKKPTGGILATGTIDANSFTTNTSGLQYEILLSPAASLTNGQRYVFVLSCPSGDGSNYAVILRQTANVYPDGIYLFSSNSGSTWDTTAYALVFEAWGEVPIVAAPGGSPLATMIAEGII